MTSYLPEGRKGEEGEEGEEAGTETSSCSFDRECRSFPRTPPADCYFSLFGQS